MERLTTEDIIQKLCTTVGATINKEPKDIDVDTNILEFGLDSLRAVSLIGEIEHLLNIELAVTALWDYPTIRLLAEYIVNAQQQKV